MSLKKLSASAGAVALAVSLAACGGGDSSAGEEGGALKWAHQPGNPADIPFLVGQELGTFEDADIALESVGVTGGNANQIAALASGNADFYIGTVDALASAVAAGQDLRIFCGLIPETPLPLLATPSAGLSTLEENGGDWEKTVAQFDGLKIGVPARGSSYELKTSAILATAGVSPDDVTYVPVGVGPAVVAAIDAGQIDAMLAYPFLPEQLSASGAMEQIVDANADGPEEIRGQLSTVLIATSKWIDENGDSAKALCDTVDPIDEAVKDPANEEAVKSVLESNSGVTGEALEQAYAFVTADYYGSEVSEEGLDKALNLMMDAGTIDEGSLDYDALVQQPE